MAAEDRLGLVLNARTRCFGPDGKMKWEADIEPLKVALDTVEVSGAVPAFQITTAQIKTGREHF